VNYRIVNYSVSLFIARISSLMLVDIIYFNKKNSNNLSSFIFTLNYAFCFNTFVLLCSLFVSLFCLYPNLLHMLFSSLVLRLILKFSYKSGHFSFKVSNVIGGTLSLITSSVLLLILTENSCHEGSNLLKSLHLSAHCMTISYISFLSVIPLQTIR
jgi:hypothetical protein